jgi:6-phosphogluconate dehydrogenase (decarboxylating)|tara:strand:+ start:207 stop:482 length:276 start_codon:yes stop_codon:yes gene_type:complete
MDIKAPEEDFTYASLPFSYEEAMFLITCCKTQALCAERFRENIIKDLQNTEGKLPDSMAARLQKNIDTEIQARTLANAIAHRFLESDKKTT